MKITQIEIILYVSNQQESCVFYRQLLDQEPILDVLGMTEFYISDMVKLGLMPNDGIAKILEDKLQHPSKGNGIPRCELYLYVENIVLEVERIKNLGVKLISPLKDRDWGDRVCYFSDLDGHVVALAEKL
ncbi:MAG: VOC family protein [Flavobacteriia bacterium]|jgi:uncharacterized glyoxalase superfamily protein PhnB